MTIRYAQIKEMDISNGEGVGVSLFVQGCHFKCQNCFNPETWDFEAGNLWIEESQKTLENLMKREYVQRLSFLGGEPLCDENVKIVLEISNKIRLLFPRKKIWIYTGYEWENIFNDGVYLSVDCTGALRRKAVRNCDVLVDGRYIDSQRDITLPFRGSKNQRLIDVQKSLQDRKLTEYKIN